MSTRVKKDPETGLSNGVFTLHGRRHGSLVDPMHTPALTDDRYRYYTHHQAPYSSCSLTSRGLSLSLTTTSDALDLFVLMMRGAVLKMIPEHGGLYCKKFGASIRGE